MRSVALDLDVSQRQEMPADSKGSKSEASTGGKQKDPPGLHLEPKMKVSSVAALHVSSMLPGLPLLV